MASDGDGRQSLERGGGLMTTSIWKRQRAIFDAALEYEGGALADFLASSCAGEPDLRRTVERLLAARHDLSAPLDFALELRILAPAKNSRSVHTNVVGAAIILPR